MSAEHFGSPTSRTAEETAEIPQLVARDERRAFGPAAGVDSGRRPRRHGRGARIARERRPYPHPAETAEAPETGAEQPQQAKPRPWWRKIFG